MNNIAIKPAELNVLSNYLADLQLFASKGQNDHGFYDRWQDRIQIITEIVSRLDIYLKAKDPQAAETVEGARFRPVHYNEFTTFEKHITYYLSGIKIYQYDLEDALIQEGLLDKLVQEMTGFEFKTLLLTTLKEYQDRQSIN